jgi:hypothetical protein
MAFARLHWQWSTFARYGRTQRKSVRWGTGGVVQMQSKSNVEFVFLRRFKVVVGCEARVGFRDYKLDRCSSWTLYMLWHWRSDFRFAPWRVHLYIADRCKPITCSRSKNRQSTSPSTQNVHYYNLAERIIARIAELQRVAGVRCSRYWKLHS